MTPEEQFLLDTPEFAALSSPETQAKRNEMRLAVLETEQKSLPNKDQSLEGDIKKQKANMSGYGGFPNYTGLDIEEKPVDHEKVASELSNTPPINISSIETKDTSEKLPKEEELSNMSFDRLVELRSKYVGDPELQRKLAPYEHRAFAREVTMDTSGLAAIPLIPAIAGYQGLKAAGADVRTTTEPTTQASIKQAVEATKGVAEGVALSVGEEILSWLNIEIERPKYRQK